MRSIRPCSAKAIRETTLATGKRQPAQRRGFTLVEILVVITIIITLFSLVAVSMSTFMKNAHEKATTSLIQRLQTSLDDYKSKTGYYPPDGIDSPQENAEGTHIEGSACLYHFLMSPIIVEEIVSGVKKVTRHEPVLLQKLGENELFPENPAYPGAREIKDGWGNALHYDNTEDGVFRPQRGMVHLPPLGDEEHPPDPRDPSYTVGGQPAVSKPGEVQSRSYDLWSHGDQGHEISDETNLPIASWNIK